MMWLKNMMMELDFRQPGCLCIVIISHQFIAQNSVFHKRTKHIEIDCNLVRDAWTKKVVSLPFIPSSKQLTDLLTKAVSPHVFFNLCSKLGMIDIYASA